jgi:hypothetical protein
VKENFNIAGTPAPIFMELGKENMPNEGILTAYIAKLSPQ